MPARPEKAEMSVELEHDLDAMLMKFDTRAEQVRRQLTMSARALAVYDRAIAAVDRSKVRDLQAFIREQCDWLVEEPGFKYLDLPRYLADKTRWIIELDLDTSPPVSILDLGVGGGHFPFLASTFGHRVVGVDMSNDIYTRLLDVYSVERVVHMIMPGVPLPVTGKFDLVTALQMTFNKLSGKIARRPEGHYWTAAEWAGLFDDLSAHLNFSGQIFLGLNRQAAADGTGDHADQLMTLFERNGATIDRKKYSVHFRLQEPLKLKA
jgi:SAM-dependent methyltransferase